MKIRFCLLVTGFLVGLVYSAHARIGESTDQIQERYGAPKQSPHVGGGSFGIGYSIPVKFYEKDDLQIRVGIVNGISVQEIYSKKSNKDRLFVKEIDALLDANSGGKKWVLVESKTTKREIGKTPDYTNAAWKREDGATARNEWRDSIGFCFTVAVAPSVFKELRAAAKAEKEKKAKTPTGF